jgi:hypothetical protein
VTIVRRVPAAVELDPASPVPHWGIALALGPNINLDVDPEREKAAYEAVQKALKLAEKAPEQERAYARALARRYSADRTSTWRNPGKAWLPGRPPDLFGMEA